METTTLHPAHADRIFTAIHAHAHKSELPHPHRLKDEHARLDLHDSFLQHVQILNGYDQEYGEPKERALTIDELFLFLAEEHNLKKFELTAQHIAKKNRPDALAKLQHISNALLKLRSVVEIAKRQMKGENHDVIISTIKSIHNQVMTVIDTHIQTKIPYRETRATPLEVAMAQQNEPYLSKLSTLEAEFNLEPDLAPPTDLVHPLPRKSAPIKTDAKPYKPDFTRGFNDQTIPPGKVVWN